jgi:hypothetical protein
VTGPRRSGSTWLLVLVLLLPVVVAGALWVWQERDRSALEASQAEDRAALNAATRETMAWATVDYRDVDGYIKAVESGATGKFLSQFQESKAALRQLLATNKSVQVPTIPSGGVGLLERNGAQARVLVAMDAAVTNKSTKKPQPRQYRLQVTMQRRDGEWFTSGLEFIDART